MQRSRVIDFWWLFLKSSHRKKDLLHIQVKGHWLQHFSIWILTSIKRFTTYTGQGSWTSAWLREIWAVCQNTHIKTDMASPVAQNTWQLPLDKKKLTATRKSKSLKCSALASASLVYTACSVFKVTSTASDFPPHLLSNLRLINFFSSAAVSMPSRYAGKSKTISKRAKPMGHLMLIPSRFQNYLNFFTDK